MGKSTISMAISNSYVKLPEGTTPGLSKWSAVEYLWRRLCAAGEEALEAGGSA